jgi:hypothetical protein
MPVEHQPTGSDGPWIGWDVFRPVVPACGLVRGQRVELGLLYGHVDEQWSRIRRGRAG